MKALDLGVAFDFGFRIAFPKTTRSATKKRLTEAITTESMAVSWVLDARLNGVESAFAAGNAFFWDFPLAARHRGANARLHLARPAEGRVRAAQPLWRRVTPPIYADNNLYLLD
jgi:hypothetical protein